MTNETMTAITALELYRNKDIVEKAFGNLKLRRQPRYEIQVLTGKPSTRYTTIFDRGVIMNTMYKYQSLIILILAGFLGLVLIYDSYIPASVKSSTQTVKLPKFKSDFEQITKKLKLSINAKVNVFELAFNGYDGTIEIFECIISDTTDKRILRHNITLDTTTNQYKIHTSKIDNPKMTKTTLPALRLFEVLDFVEFDDILSSRASGYYVLMGNGEKLTRPSSIPLKDYRNLKGKNFVKLEPNQSVSAYEFSLLDNEKILRTYWFD